MNPLAASFFALCEIKERDTAIYALNCSCKLDTDQSVVDFQGLARYDPPIFADRIFQQRAVFSVTAPPFEDLQRDVWDNASVVKLVVPAGSRELILRKVVSFGADRSFLFQDLDGSAAHVNWFIENVSLLKDAVPEYHKGIEEPGIQVQKAEIKEMFSPLERAIAEIEERLSELKKLVGQNSRRDG